MQNAAYLGGARLVALALAVAALGLPAAHASSPPPVLGLVYTAGYGNSIVTLFDPVTLERSGPRVRLGGNASSWSYSPQRRYLAIASYPQRLTVIDVAALRVAARRRLASGGGVVYAVSWVAPSRVLAVVNTPNGARVVAIDPLAGRVVRRTKLRRPFAYAVARLPDGFAFVLGPRRGLAPVQVAVADAEGGVRIATVGSAAIGSVARGSGAEWCSSASRPGTVLRSGFAPATRCPTLLAGDSRY